MIYDNPNCFIAESTLLEGNFFEEIDRWKTHNQNHSIQQFKSNSITDEEYEHLKSCLDIMKAEDVSYDDYKKAFARFCYFCHIVPRGVIFKTYDLKKGKDGKNSIFVEYSYNTKKIQLPDDVNLYHMSKVSGIKELLPFFKGKSAKGYLYDKPRIYFTIRRHMPKFLADYKINEKMHIYLCKEKIKQVFVDPLVWSNLQGAVYVESNKPIKVEELTASNADKIISTSEQTSVNFEHLLNFVTENGLALD